MRLKSSRISRASFHTARSAAASVRSFGVLPSREKIDSATLSTTVSWSKRFTSWKLRAMPARMRPYTVWCVTSTSRKRISPLSGGKRPLIRLTSVVFPAPFEPISARTSRSFTVKLTPSTARKAPKLFTRSRVTRRSMSAVPPPHPQPLGGADEARRQREHEHHEHHAEEELPVDGVADRERLEVVEDDRADDRARERPEAAEHGHEDDLAGELPEQDVRRREPVERHPERARDPGEDARHHERDPPVAPDADPDELRARLVVADRLQRLAERRVHDDPHQHDAPEEDSEHVGG